MTAWGEVWCTLKDVWRAWRHERNKPYRPKSTMEWNAVAEANTAFDMAVIAERMLDIQPEIFNLSLSIEVEIRRGVHMPTEEMVATLTIAHDQTGNRKQVVCTHFIMNMQQLEVTSRLLAYTMRNYLLNPDNILTYYSELV